MATPESKAPEKPVQKDKPGPAGKPVKATKKSARQFAVEILKKHGGKMKFGELVNAVTKRMLGDSKKKLGWVPTYYLNSPGFSKPERGIVQYSETEEKKAREVIVAARRERLAKVRKSKPKAEGKAGKSKAPKKESVLERRQRTAAEKKAKDEAAKAEFEEAAAAAKAEQD